METKLIKIRLLVNIDKNMFDELKNHFKSKKGHDKRYTENCMEYRALREFQSLYNKYVLTDKLDDFIDEKREKKS